ncbi:C-x8-C-x5-C-x3-H type zinc finger protein [Histoplasma capsulatum H143]|uniref:C-x8-C-x5-C-x3-H type zinc finger protein n=1 Tax=Ajellomyces capsulatus (strain H143) TaxID=544712 RepID=C6HBS3_AJECH|nr:C-x8-C-x5-C-x3-H type zinc finger protein [Histoplasma capsulatum H143]
MASSTAQEFFQRYEQVKAVEQSRNELIEDLLRRVAELENAYQQTRLDHERESRFNREVQMHEIELMNQITAMESVMEQEPFLLVLLDGDGMVFQDSFLQQGEQGGKDGANQLWAAIRDYASRNLPNIPSPKIIARVYANVKGLADACYKAGLIERPGLIEEFARGFNGSRLLFDFVDVGVGKDRADDKIAEVFKLHLYNCHCHQIFLGCSHDNGYARLLEDTLADRDLVGRISLIEGVPFERELVPIKASYRVTKFEELFRTSKINTNSLSWNDRNGTNNNIMSIPSSTPLSVLSANTPGNNNNLARIPSNSTIPSNGTNTPPTWAATTAAGAHGPFTDLTTSKPSSPAPPKNERTVLHAVARMTPCRFGTDCDDPGCIYGHRCPQSEIGKKDCFWGSNCRFDTAAHGIDTTIVKVTKV